jgi:hypothetical protein
MRLAISAIYIRFRRTQLAARFLIPIPPQLLRYFCFAYPALDILLHFLTDISHLLNGCAPHVAGISVGKVLPVVSSMADFNPTLLALISTKRTDAISTNGGDAYFVDGTSFASLLLAETEDTTITIAAAAAAAAPAIAYRSDRLYAPVGEGQNTADVVQQTTARAATLGFTRTATLIEYHSGSGNR